MNTQRKDWTGNKKTLGVTLGASNHTFDEREKNDFYATDPLATELLLDNEQFNKSIWEPACGGGHMARVLEAKGYKVISTDIVDRGYGDIKDFFSFDGQFEGDIITNPPYRYALEFCKKALDSVPEGHKVAMFLRLQFLESKARKPFFLENPPKTVYVSASRLRCAKNGDFTSSVSSAVAYAWFVWEKGYKGQSVIKWIN